MKKGNELKPHIGIFGRRNVGKSSFINAITMQDIAIVSSTPGTTTDPVKKSYEIFSIGPVVLIDTAGIDDEGELGHKRIEKTLQVIESIDLAILLVTNNEFGKYEMELIEKFNEYEIPYVIIFNKIDIYTPRKDFINLIKEQTGKDVIFFSCLKPENVKEIIKIISQNIPDSAYKKSSLLGDIIHNGDIILLIVPIDIEAPEGRLILPQVQVIRDILDNDAIAIVLKEKEVEYFLRHTKIKPKLAITDSQIFQKANAMIPHDVMLTSFSIVLARNKGPFELYLKGTPKIDELKDNDNVLILESCSHQISCEDIGRVKIPRWLEQYTGKKLNIDVVSSFNMIPKPIEKYSLVIQCGGCVITRRQLFNRLKPAIKANIPVTNYGLAISYLQGIFKRAIEPFVKESNESFTYI